MSNNLLNGVQHIDAEARSRHDADNSFIDFGLILRIETMIRKLHIDMNAIYKAKQQQALKLTRVAPVRKNDDFAIEAGAYLLEHMLDFLLTLYKKFSPAEEDSVKHAAAACNSLHDLCGVQMPLRLLGN
ncbi:hypothetical protein D3C78_1264720 [compost metagenome]